MAICSVACAISEKKSDRASLYRNSALSVLAFSLLALPHAARADNECGPATGATVTCTSAGNNYPNGITYVAPPQDLTIVLNPDVVVDTSGTFGIGVIAVADPTNSITVSADTGASITTSDPGSFGVLVGTTAGNATANTSSIVTRGDAADGIFATADTGTVNVTSGTTYTYGEGARGISAYTGTGTINASGFTVVTNGNDAAGFNLQSQNGDVNATLARGIFGGTVLTYGDNSTGVLATAGGNGNVSITGPGAGGFGSAAIVTSGAGSTGIDAQAQAGNVTIDVGQVQTTGAGSDAILATSATGGVNVNASTVTADDGRGVVATGGSSATVTQSGNFIATGGDNHAAVTVLATAGPAMANIGNASTNGANSNAVDVSSPTGMATANVGAATTQGDGSVGVIVSGNTGASAIANSTRTYGANANGIQVTSATGTASVTAGMVATSGDGSAAIVATGGNANVTANGAISRTGATGIGVPDAAIAVTGTAGTASATVGNVMASGTGLTAVLVDGSTTASATVSQGGSVSGNVDALAITSGSGATVTNNGTINTGTGYALRATGGAAAVTNSGTVNGRVLLTGAGDSFGNTGLFNAVGNSDFGAGADSFSNSGTLRVLPASGVAGTVQFANLESFAASGLVDLRNGHTGDVLDLGNAAFTGSGNSRLGLDISLNGTPQADRLNTGVASGSTQVLVSGGPTGPSPLGTSVLVVQGQSGSSAGAFTLAPGQIGYGFTAYRIVYNPTNFSYNLVAVPSDAAFRPLKLVEGARTLWYKSADAWSAHMTALRDAAWRGGDTTEKPGSALWLQMYGSTDTRRQANQSFTAFGSTSRSNPAYQQDAFGGQIGYDLGRPKPEGGLVFGVTAGYANSDMNFAGSVDHVNYDAANVGAYASYVSGRFFINGLAKYDRYWIDTRFGDGAYRRKLHGDGYGGQVEAGFRLGSDRFFVEPLASASYVKTSIDKLRVPNFNLSFDDRNGIRGKAGARMGAAFDMGGNRGLFYASAMAVHEFQGEDRLRMISGDDSLSFRNARLPTYAQGTVGFNVTTGRGMTGFVEGTGDYSKNYRGGGVRGGLRFPL